MKENNWSQFIISSDSRKTRRGVGMKPIQRGRCRGHTDGEYIFLFIVIVSLLISILVVENFYTEYKYCKFIGYDDSILSLPGEYCCARYSTFGQLIASDCFDSGVANENLEKYDTVEELIGIENNILN